MSLRDVAAALDAAAGDLALDPDIATTPVTPGDRDALRVRLSRLASGDFAPTELADIAAAGLTADEIGGLRDQLAPTLLDGVATDRTLPAYLAGAADDFTNASYGFDQFARAAEFAATSTNQPPVAAFVRSSTSSAPLVATFTDMSTNPDRDELTYTWSFGDGSGSTDASPVHTFADPGTYVVHLEVCDLYAACSETQQTTNVGSNQSPIALPDVLVTAVGVARTLNALANDTDADGDALTLTGWTSGAHGLVTCLFDGSCTYTPASGYFGPDTFTYTVGDGRGGSATGSVAVTVVANQAPAVGLPANLSVDEGIQLTITPDVSDPDGTIASYTWDLGDGRTSAQPTLTTSYPDEGTFTVKLTVTDDLGATATATTVVTVRNVAPTVLILAPTFSRVPPGAARFFTAVGGDSGDDALTYTWDFGDGTSGTGSTVSHAWATTGVYALSVRVEDGDGGTVTATHTVTVALVTADAGPDRTIDEGSSASLGGPGSSPADALTSHAWDFGDGASSDSGQHVYRDNGTYQAKLTVTDDVGSATDEATVVVRNVAPTIKGVAAPKETAVGTVSSFRAFVSDPGPDDTFSASWDFGDGGSAAALAADHAFSTAGSYTVQLRVEDDDGGVTTATRSIRVVAAASGVPDSYGRDFWIDFDDNPVEDSTKLTLFVTGVRATQGAVEIPGIGYATNFAVSANEITQVAIPLGAMLGQQDTRGVEPRAIHVTADDDVVVYGLNRTRETTDAYLAQPTDTQGTRYRVMGYGGLPGSLFSVVASRNATDVTITPAVAVEEHAAGVPFSVRLDAGETYELEATAGSDLTGTLVASTAPVAVFGGHRCAFVPVDFFACNHLIEQLPPVTAWGRSYVTAPLAGRRQDTLRILADADATAVVIQSSGGSQTITLNAGQRHEFLTGEPTSITADKPVLVAQFSNGSQFDDTVSDPFMVVVPPYEQYLTSYVVATRPTVSATTS